MRLLTVLLFLAVVVSGFFFIGKRVYHVIDKKFRGSEDEE
jgi:hypothetical protein